MGTPAPRHLTSDSCSTALEYAEQIFLSDLPLTAPDTRNTSLSFRLSRFFFQGLGEDLCLPEASCGQPSRSLDPWEVVPIYFHSMWAGVLSEAETRKDLGGCI